MAYMYMYVYAVIIVYFYKYFNYLHYILLVYIIAQINMYRFLIYGCIIIYMLTLHNRFTYMFSFLEDVFVIKLQKIFNRLPQINDINCLMDAFLSVAHFENSKNSRLQYVSITSLRCWGRPTLRWRLVNFTTSAILVFVQIIIFRVQCTYKK